MTSQPQSTSLPPPPPTSTPNPSAIYPSLQSYPFDTDADYLSGLASILGHPSILPTSEELTSLTNADLILQVRCFYFARKHDLPPIDPAAYAEWLSMQRNNSTDIVGGTEPVTSNAAQQPEPIAAATETAAPTNTTVAQAQPSSTADQQQPPPYPTSFAAIVDLITRNVPVPGIEEIPNTVLEHGSSKVDHTPRRKKPWESDDGGGDDVMAALSAGGAATLTTGTDAGTETPSLPQLQQTNPGSEDQDPAAVAEENHSITTEEQQQQPPPPPPQPTINGHLATGEGIVKILQPNAIPDSGLLAKD